MKINISWSWTNPLKVPEPPRAPIPEITYAEFKQELLEEIARQMNIPTRVLDAAPDLDHAARQVHRKLITYNHED